MFRFFQDQTLTQNPELIDSLVEGGFIAPVLVRIIEIILIQQSMELNLPFPLPIGQLSDSQVDKTDPLFGRLRFFDFTPYRCNEVCDIWKNRLSRW
jgi:hypothetical protein